MIKHNYSLLSHNSFGFDIKADTFVDYSTETELIDFLRHNNADDTPLLHIGGGNNLLFTGDFAGTVLHSSIKDISVTDETDDSITLRVGSGIVFDDLCRYTVEHNIGGLENLSLIPSEVGAAAIQNIGAYGTEIKDLITKVDTIEIATGKRRTFTAAECMYGYRNSIFKTALAGQYIVVYVGICLTKNPKPNIEYAALRNELADNKEPSIYDVREAVIRIRNAKLPDPKVLGNAGSFFKNPYCTRGYYEDLRRKYCDIPHYDISEEEVKIPAAYLIERCGFKGIRYGNVGAYDKQPLVLVNYGGATPDEVIALADNIEKSVLSEFGISLEREVIYV